MMKRENEILLKFAEAVCRDENGAERPVVLSADSGVKANAGESAARRIEYTAPGLAFAVEISFDAGDMILTIPRDSIREDGNLRFKSLRPFPGLLAVGEGQGTLALPIHDGILCHARNKAAAEYDIPIFYPFPSLCNMPLCGLVTNEDAVAATVEGGLADCSFKLCTCQGREKTYSLDWVFALRDYPDENILNEDLSIRLRRLHGSEANYAGIARWYRKYNRRCRKLPLLSERFKDNPALRYSAGAVAVWFRLASKPRPATVLHQTPENEPPLHVYADFNKVAELAEACARQQVGPLEFVFVGWNHRGHCGAFPQLLPVEAALGGETTLRSVLERFGELGYAASGTDNHFYSFELANNFNVDYLQWDHDGKTKIGGHYPGGAAYQLCPRCAYEKYACKSLAAEAELGFNGIHYTDIIGVAQLEKCHHPEHPVSRRECAVWRKKIMAEAGRYFGGCNSEGVRDWALPELVRSLWVSSGTCFDAPFADEVFPLFQMIYHGFLIYNSHFIAINALPGSEAYLRNISYGGLPLVYYYHNPTTGPECGEIDLEAKKLKRITADATRLAPVHSAVMEDFIVQAPLLTETRYGNGLSVYCNYGEGSKHTAGGLLVPPHNFILDKTLN